MKLNTLILTLTLTIIAYAGTVQACAAFLESDYQSGQQRVCIYDHLGDVYVQTVRYPSLCPQVVYVDH